MTEATRIKLRIADVELLAETLDTPTAAGILESLPFSSSACTWGEEVYFQAPVQAQPEEDARGVMELNELAFWVEGGCIAIGYVPHPGFARRGDSGWPRTREYLGPRGAGRSTRPAGYMAW